jgi:HemY protein
VRRLFLLLLCTLLAAGSLAWLVRTDSGYVLLQYGHTRLETTVWFALAALLAMVLILQLALRCLGLVSRLLTRLSGGRSAPAVTGRRDRTAQGMRAFFEGDWERGGRLLARGAESSAYPLANYLLAARAAVLRGDAELAEGFLTLAAALPDATESVRLERARTQARLGNHAGVVAALAAGAESPAALELLLPALAQTGDWTRLAALLPDARRAGAMPEATLDELEERAFATLIGRAGTDAQASRRAWESLPARLRKRPALVAIYARSLAAHAAAAEAVELLESALAREWSAQLVEVLGMIPAQDPDKAFARAEKLLARHPDDAVALLALGRRAMAARLWGKARDYLEASLARAERAETCELLAQVSAHTGDAERARKYRERAAAP